MKLIMLIILLTSCATGKLSIPKIAAKHVVRLESMNTIGTGFYVLYKGKSYLVSNKHVCEGYAQLHDGEDFRNVIALDTKHDLCLLDSDRNGGLNIATRDLEQFDELHVVGHPLGRPLTTRSGSFIEIGFNKLGGLFEEPRYYIHAAMTIFSGNSGSPVLNSDGGLVGVVFATDPMTYSDAFIVPVSELIRFLKNNG